MHRPVSPAAPLQPQRPQAPSGHQQDQRPRRAKAGHGELGRDPALGAEHAGLEAGAVGRARQGRMLVKRRRHRPAQDRIMDLRGRQPSVHRTGRHHLGRGGLQANGYALALGQDIDRPPLLQPPGGLIGAREAIGPHVPDRHRRARGQVLSPAPIPVGARATRRLARQRDPDIPVQRQQAPVRPAPAALLIQRRPQPRRRRLGVEVTVQRIDGLRGPPRPGRRHERDRLATREVRPGLIRPFRRHDRTAFAPSRQEAHRTRRTEHPPLSRGPFTGADADGRTARKGLGPDEHLVHGHDRRGLVGRPRRAHDQLGHGLVVHSLAGGRQRPQRGEPRRRAFDGHAVFRPAAQAQPVRARSQVQALQRQPDLSEPRRLPALVIGQHRAADGRQHQHRRDQHAQRHRPGPRRPLRPGPLPDQPGQQAQHRRDEDADHSGRPTAGAIIQPSASRWSARCSDT